MFFGKKKKPKQEKCIECGYLFREEDKGARCPMCETYRYCPFCENPKIEKVFPSSMMVVKTVASLEFRDSVAANQFRCKKCGHSF